MLELLDALDNVNLKNFLESQSGLDTGVESMLLTSQVVRSRELVLARALLHDTPVYAC